MHGVWAVHAPWLALDVKLPVQGPQMRSRYTSGVTTTNVPAAHTACAVQSPLPTLALKVPLPHGAHTRSDVPVGATDSYSPVWHTVVSLHTRFELLVGALLSYSAALHSFVLKQERSALAVGAVASYSSPEHSCTATQAAAELYFEKFVPATHDSHWRSDVLLGATSCPSPTAQSACTAHASVASVLALALALN